MNPQLYTDQVNRNEKKRMREERHEKNKLGKNEYIQMLKDDEYDGPEERNQNLGMRKKTQYIKEMEKLEEVEGMFFQRMNMTKE